MFHTMKRILAGAAVVAAGLSMSWPAQAIVGGAPDAGEHPFVGQLLFYVPSAIDPRFDDPGGWFNCTGTLINATTVVTAGHCTFDVGDDGVDAGDGYDGGNDIWFSVAEAPDYSILPPSSGFVPDDNAGRYEAWSTALDNSGSWHETEAAYTHPDYVDAEFLLHDVGVFTLSEPVDPRRVRRAARGGLPRHVRRLGEARCTLRVGRLRARGQLAEVIGRW